jgi:hypothetical protein
MSDENPYQSPNSDMTAAPAPILSSAARVRRWRNLISTTIFATVALTATTWSWYEDKLVIALVALACAAAIRWYPGKVVLSRNDLQQPIAEGAHSKSGDENALT